MSFGAFGRGWRPHAFRRGAAQEHLDAIQAAAEKRSRKLMMNLKRELSAMFKMSGVSLEQQFRGFDRCAFLMPFLTPVCLSSAHASNSLCRTTQSGRTLYPQTLDRTVRGTACFHTRLATRLPPLSSAVIRTESHRCFVGLSQ